MKTIQIPVYDNLDDFLADRHETFKNLYDKSVAYNTENYQNILKKMSQYQEGIEQEGYLTTSIFDGKEKEDETKQIAKIITFYLKSLIDDHECLFKSTAVKPRYRTVYYSIFKFVEKYLSENPVSINKMAFGEDYE